MPFIAPNVTYTSNDSPLFVAAGADGSADFANTVTISPPAGSLGLVCNGQGIFQNLVSVPAGDAQIQVKNGAEDGMRIRADGSSGVVTFEVVNSGGTLPASITIDTGGATTLNGTTTVTRAAAGVDGYLKVLNNGGEGIGIRAYDPASGKPNGTIALQTVINSTTNSTGGLVFDPAGNVSIPDQKSMTAGLFNLAGAPVAGNYGKATIAGAGNLVVSNTGITAGSIVMVTPQSATAVAEPLRITVTPGTSFTIFNDNVGAVTAMYAVLSLDGAA